MLYTLCTPNNIISLQAFANYLAYKRDNNELLLFILRQLAGDHLNFNRNRFGADVEIIEVPEDEFVEKVIHTFAVVYCCLFLYVLTGKANQHS